MWQYGALARLNKHQSIDELLHNGYSTISLGYAGLYECIKYMTGKSHTDNAEGTEFGLKVMRALDDKCNQWKRGNMTGITRVSKESIFSDLNNLEVVTTTLGKYMDAFGFTQEEVRDALHEFGCLKKRWKSETGMMALRLEV